MYMSGELSAMTRAKNVRLDERRVYREFCLSCQLLGTQNMHVVRWQGQAFRR